MKGYPISGMDAKVLTQDNPAGLEGIAFGAINGRLVIAIADGEKSYVVALGGACLDLACNKIADAMQEIALANHDGSGGVQ